MKKWLLLFVICGLWRLSVVGCDIEISSSTEKAAIGSTVELTVKVFYEHRKCLIKPEDTEFKLIGLKLIESDEWKKEGSLAIYKKIKVVILNKEAAIEVSRHCAKKELSFARLEIIPQR